MKLFIDIPEKMYYMIKAGFYDYGDMNLIIQNGTPLPKDIYLEEEFEDLKDFASDIIALRDNYNNISPYYCEDLEFDFFTFMEKWSKKIEHYKWGRKE